MSKYPEHEKMELIKDKSQTIGEFLEWLQGPKGIVLSEWPDPDGSDELYPVYIPTKKLLAEFFGIDLEKIEAEKDAMLEEMRSARKEK